MIRGEALETSLTLPGQRRLVLFADPQSLSANVGADSGTPRFNRPLAVALALALAACQTPAIKERVVTVSVPVAITPIRPADVPPLPAPLPKRPADARRALDLALSKVCEWVAFGLRADPLLRVSSGQAQQAVQAYPECGER